MCESEPVDVFIIAQRMSRLLRHLRSRNDPSALILTNMLHDFRKLASRLKAKEPTHV